MTIGYRIPRGVSEFTSVLVPRIAPSLEAPSSIRESESSSVVLLEADEDLVLEALAAIDSESSEGRSEALIVPEALFDEALAVVLTPARAPVGRRRAGHSVDRLDCGKRRVLSSMWSALLSRRAGRGLSDLRALMRIPERRKR